jgi:NADH-quinone oxidoreductase subunit L
MRRMGGLAKKIPITYWTMLIASVAIAGIPPLAGFFSKDEILGEAFKNGFWWVSLTGYVVAAMTAFYMFRLIGLTFWGKSRVDPAVEPKIHESPRTMTVPLILLAIPTVVLGALLALPLGDGVLKHWLEPIFAGTIERMGGEHPFALFGIDGALILASVLVAVLGVLAAWRLFGVELPVRSRLFNQEPQPERVKALSERVPFLYRASLNKWWFDELNHLLFIVIGGRVAAALWWFDTHVVDGTVNGIGAVTRRGGRGLSRIQTGRVQNYAFGIALGLIVMAGAYFAVSGK